MLCAEPRRSDVVRLKRANVAGGRLIYRQKKMDAEINIPLAKAPSKCMILQQKKTGMAGRME